MNCLKHRDDVNCQRTEFFLFLEVTRIEIRRDQPEKKLVVLERLHMRIRNSISAFLFLWALSAVTSLMCWAAVSTSHQDLEVSPLKVSPNVQLPGDYQQAIQKQLFDQLAKSKIFDSVSDMSSTVSNAKPPESPKWRLTCVVTEFQAGSRAKRIFSGGIGRMAGVGKTKLVTHIVIEQEPSGVKIYEGDVSGAEKATGLNPAASSKGVIEIEAKQIAKEVQREVTKFSTK